MNNEPNLFLVFSAGEEELQGARMSRSSNVEPSKNPRGIELLWGWLLSVGMRVLAKHFVEARLVLVAQPSEKAGAFHIA